MATLHIHRPPIPSDSDALVLTGTARTVLLMCGIASSLLYVAMNIFVPLQWDSYDVTSQTVSELSAIGAPTRLLWFALGVVYALLAAAFGYGVWSSTRGTGPLRAVGALLLANGLISLVWPPMHQRQVLAAGGGTWTDTLHIVWSIATVALMLLAIGFGARAFGKRFRAYSIVTLVLLFVTGALTAIDAPRIEANVPTPWVGVWERISIGLYMLWVVVLASRLLRTPDAVHQAPQG